MKKLIILLTILLSFSFLVSCNSTIQDADDKGLNIIPPTVKFETYGGKEIEAQQTNLIKTEPKTSRENYYFLGWYLDEHYNTAAVFPLSVEYDTTLHAKWLKIKDTKKINDATISGKSGYSSAVSCNASPPDFDFDELSQQGLKLRISVSYDINYKKSYNVIGNIGYMGAPKYEVYLMGEDLKGNYEEDVPTPSSPTTSYIVMTTAASYYKDNIITLTFSTNNIQNLIQISNVVITYECGK